MSACFVPATWLMARACSAAAKCAPKLTHLFSASDLAPGADGCRPGDVPAIPVGGDGRDFASASVLGGLDHSELARGAAPNSVRPRSLGWPAYGPVFHGLVTLGQCAGHLRVGDSSRPGDEPGDEVVGAPPPATGRLGPPINPAVEHRGHVDGVGQGPAGDQLREGRLDIEATGFGLAERREQRTVRLAGTDGVEVCRREP